MLAAPNTLGPSSINAAGGHGKIFRACSSLSYKEKTTSFARAPCAHQKKKNVQFFYSLSSQDRFLAHVCIYYNSLYCVYFIDSKIVGARPFFSSISLSYRLRTKRRGLERATDAVTQTDGHTHTRALASTNKKRRKKKDRAFVRSTLQKSTKH